ncbi:MAG: TolC family protein [Calditrichaeota bacterium]|nr:TolC family protein [Calditrichota bacterium]
MRVYLSLILFMFFIPGLSRAQTEAGLRELIRLSLKQNADVLVQEVQTRIAGLRGLQALSGLLPNLKADAGYVYSSVRNGAPAFVGANGEKETMAYLALHQSLFDADIWQRYRGSNIEQDKQNVLLRQIRQDVMQLVIGTYFNTLKLRGEVRIYRENLKSFRLMYEQSKLLYGSGSVPEIDVKKSRVEFLLQKNGLRQSQKEYRAALNRLKELVGLAITDSLKITDFPPQKVVLNSLQHYEKNALQHRPEWQAIKLTERGLVLRRQTAVLRNMPTVEADIYYGWDSNPPLTKRNRGWQGLVNISLPLWSWGAQKADYRIAALKLKQLRQKQQKLKKQILQEIINAYHEAQLQREQIKTMEESKSEAAQAVKMAKIGYQEGSITNLELINTQKLYTRTQVEYLAAFYNFYIAKAALLRAVGLLKEDLSWIDE